MDDAGPWRLDGEDLRVLVRVTPRGGRDAIEGCDRLADGRTVLKVRVRAVPEDGAANRAVAGLLAGAAGVARAKAEVVSGATARIKTVRLTGAGEAGLAALRRQLP
ncbi:DUF167 family protein [Methylobrevis pamukkalensis]|uniref:UPF0235 protein A6302_01591 n=1 Tax=Methylobrevis pamukkalensis TaxID=1439726 RepID=A0A1E3H451_9HYPH|nr:DUF167 family protein [Methylobrevis pamukkalensis]ODN71098.1 hypothetical protein A6302_01591 [Methylobrevis pamukkalensis]